MTRYRGRHRAPTNTGRHVARVTAGAAIAAAPLGVVPGTAMAADEPPWGRIVACESGGRNIPNAGGSSASGYFQITDGTWRSAGGSDFGPRAMSASFAEQLTVAKRIAARSGGASDWAASRSCWTSGRKGSVDVAALAGRAAVSTTPAVRTGGPARTHGEVRERRAVDTGSGYVVRRGDTLAKIAQARGVRGGWRALHAANRGAIGGNPNMIRVGVSLTIPGA